MNAKIEYIGVAVKNRYGDLRAGTRIALSRNLILDINTYKSSAKQLITSATVGKGEGDMISVVLGQGYNKIIASSTPARITKNVMETQHNTVDFEAIITEAKAFYNLAND